MKAIFIMHVLLKVKELPIWNSIWFLWYVLWHVVLNITHFQVREDDIWNDFDGHELTKNFESDNAIYLYAKKRTVETVSGHMETRTNSYGYAVPCSLCSFWYRCISSYMSLFHLFNKLSLYLGSKSWSAQTCWQNITNHYPVASVSGSPIMLLLLCLFVHWYSILKGRLWVL